MYIFVCVCQLLRMKAVQTKEAATPMMRDGTRHLQNLPAFAGKTCALCLVKV